MKNLIKTTIVIIGLSTSTAYAGGLSSPWDEPELTVIKCPTYGILWGLIKWEWCGNGYPSSGGQPSGGSLLVGPDIQGDVLDDRPDDDDDVLGNPGNDKGVGRSGEKSDKDMDERDPIGNRGRSN